MNRWMFPSTKKLVTILLVLYWITLFASTHVPSRMLGGIQIWDKLAHGVTYAGLGFLLAWVTAPRLPSPWLYVWLFALVLLYGAADELSQIPVPGRSADLHDWLADGLGAAIGLSLHWLVLMAWSAARATRLNAERH